MSVHRGYNTVSGRHLGIEDNFDSVSAISHRSSRSAAAKANKKKQMSRTVVQRKIEDVYNTQPRHPDPRDPVRKAGSVHSLHTTYVGSPAPQAYVQYVSNKHTLPAASEPVTVESAAQLSARGATFTRHEALKAQMRLMQMEQEAGSDATTGINAPPDDDMTLESNDGNWTIRTDPRQSVAKRSKSKRAGIPFEDYKQSQEQNNNTTGQVNQMMSNSNGYAASAQGGVVTNQGTHVAVSADVHAVNGQINQPQPAATMYSNGTLTNRAAGTAVAVGGVGIPQEDPVGHVYEPTVITTASEQSHVQSTVQSNRPHTPTHMVIAKIGQPLQIHVPQPHLPVQQPTVVAQQHEPLVRPTPVHIQTDIPSNGVVEHTGSMQRRYVRKGEQNVQYRGQITLGDNTSSNMGTKSLSVPDLFDKQLTISTTNNQPLTNGYSVEEHHRNQPQRATTPTFIINSAHKTSTIPRNVQRSVTPNPTMMHNNASNYHFSTMPRNMVIRGITTDRPSARPVTPTNIQATDCHRGEMVHVTVPQYQGNNMQGARQRFNSVPNLLQQNGSDGGARMVVHNQRSATFGTQVPAPPQRQSSQQPRENAPRTVVLAKTPSGFGFILRGAKSQVHRASVLEFSPTPEFPALQYLERVDKDSMADKAGLKRGDFILEINGENVMNATHEKTVRLIQETKDVLQMKIITVKTPTTEGVHMHMDGTRTLPMKKKEKFEVRSRQHSTEDQLDAAASSIGVDPNNKTASIKRFSKRVTAVELEDIFARQGSCESAIEVPQPVLPPGSDATLNRAQSHPNLVPAETQDIYHNVNTPDAVYSNHIETSLPNGLARTQSKTGYMSTTKADVHYQQTEAVYAVPNKDIQAQDDNDSGHASGNSGNSGCELPPAPGYPAPTPPKESIIIPPAPQHAPPAPPRGNTSPGSGEVVPIHSAPTYANISGQILARQNANKDSPYESSFRPGTNARLSKEPLATPATASLRRQSTTPQKVSVLDAVNMFEHNASNNSSTNHSVSNSVSVSNSSISEHHSVSFEDDRVYENAAHFVQTYPNASVLLTNEPQVKQQQNYEPEPDYESTVNTGSMFGNAIKNAADAREQRAKESPPRQELAQQPDSRSALLAAINKRRDEVDNSDRDHVAGSIESRVQKSTKLNGTLYGNNHVGQQNNSSISKANSEMSISSQSSDNSERSKNIGEMPAMRNEHTNGHDTDSKNFRQMAENARLQWLQKKVEPSATEHQHTNGFQQNGTVVSGTRVADLDNGVPPNPPPAPPPPPPNQAPPLPPNHPTLSRQESAGLRPVRPAVQQQQQQQQQPERKPALGELAQMIANKAKQRQLQSESIGVDNSALTRVEKSPPKNTILGQHLLNKKSPETDNKIHHINGATVDYSNTEYAMRSKMTTSRRMENPDVHENSNGTLTKDMAQLSLADKLKMFDNKHPKHPTVVEKNKVNHGYASSEVPPPMISGPYSSVTNGNSYSTTNGNHSDTVGWLINSSPSKNTHEYVVDSKLAHYRQNQVNGVQNGHIDSQVADVIHVEAIPPPPLFEQHNVAPVMNYSSHMDHDRASLVSSVSTLSTLSSVEHEHNPGSTIIEERYDDLIAPPPPPIEDSFIPPPMGFDNSPSNTLDNSHFNTVLRSPGYHSKVVSLWTVSDVGQWLHSIQQGHYSSLFNSSRIDGQRLTRLSRDNLIALGITQPGDRLTIEQAIKHLN